MINIIGQDNILKQLNLYPSFLSFPNTTLLVGEFGSGRHSICSYLSEKYNIPAMEITNNINFDTITDMMQAINVYIYIVNLSKISEREQNLLLKILEEPPKSCKFILLCEPNTNVLPTIRNRCTVIYLNRYKRADLEQFITNEMSDTILEYATTPGQILTYTALHIDETIKLSELIIDKITVASPSNILKNSLRFDFRTDKQKSEATKNEQEEYKDKLDFVLFLKTMLNLLHNKYIDTSDIKYFNAYVTTKDTVARYNVLYTDRRNIFENYLLQLKIDLTGGTN